MSRLSIHITFIVLAILNFAPRVGIAQDELAVTMPATTNNAVATATINGQPTLFSFMGLHNGKTFEDTTLDAWAYLLAEQTWQRLPDVPSETDIGRLAGIAATVNNVIYIFGGYTVAKDGSEKSIADVFAYDPQTNRYTPKKPMKIPVDDSVALVYEHFVYLVSGWHNVDNIADVQIYDTLNDRWSISKNPYPGAPVFGHAGGIIGNRFVVAGGAKVAKNQQGHTVGFPSANEAYLGEIDPESIGDETSIHWTKLDPHPASGRYRMAATGSTLLEEEIVLFAGGTDNPYNYSGVGYNKRPSRPSARVIGFDLTAGTWIEFAPKDTASMDHRGLLEVNGTFYTIGGMLADQSVTNAVLSFTLERR